MQLLESTRGRGGMTVIEILVGMTIFAIGCFTFTQVMFGAMQSKAAERFTVVATSLANERMTEIMSKGDYASLNESAWPDENFGEINGGAPEYAGFRRTVTIADSLGRRGESVLKDVRVEVQWREGGRLRHVSMRSSVPRASQAGM